MLFDVHRICSNVFFSIPDIDNLCFLYLLLFFFNQFCGGLDSRESTCKAGDSGSIPGLERLPGEGNGDPLQYSFLENSMDTGAWRATVHGVAKSLTQLSD